MASRLLLLVFTTAGLAGAVYPARAAVESFSVAEAAALGNGSVREVQIPQFNPALGSLQSATFDLRGAGVLVPALDPFAASHRPMSTHQEFTLVLETSDLQKFLTLAPVQSDFGSADNALGGATGRPSLAWKETVTLPKALLRFTGCGFVDLFLTEGGIGRNWTSLPDNLSSVSNGGMNFTVTYAYAPVPEAGAWTGGASAAAGLVLWMNRRRRRARGRSGLVLARLTTTAMLSGRGPLCSVLLALAVARSSNAAVQLEGTVGFTPVGTISYSGADLGQASSITLPATEVVNTVPAGYNGHPNDFYTGPSGIPLLSPVTIQPSTLVLPSAWGSFSPVSYPGFLVLSGGTTPGERYDFDLLGLMKTSSGPDDLEIYGTGILHDSQGVFADTPGLLSIAFTQAGQSGVVNASFSVATTAMPEPGTGVAGCFALGLLALGSLFCARQQN